MVDHETSCKDLLDSFHFPVFSIIAIFTQYPKREIGQCELRCQTVLLFGKNLQCLLDCQDAQMGGVECRTCCSYREMYYSFSILWAMNTTTRFCVHSEWDTSPLSKTFMTCSTVCIVTVFPPRSNRSKTKSRYHSSDLPNLSAASKI